MCEPQQMQLNLPGNIDLKSSFHPFFSWSQLKEESKGGYLQGSIRVPIGVKKIELSLTTKDGHPHPNLLFVKETCRPPVQHAACPQRLKHASVIHWDASGTSLGDPCRRSEILKK